MTVVATQVLSEERSSLSDWYITLQVIPCLVAGPGLEKGGPSVRGSRLTAEIVREIKQKRGARGWRNTSVFPPQTKNHLLSRKDCAIGSISI